jgi:hypothetical protein
MATADGGFLIADTDNQRVRRVSPAGTIATVAGTGTQGFSGDGGPATAAQLVGPEGVAVTASGGFLIADAAKNRVRFVDADLRFLQGPAGPPRPAGGAAGTGGCAGAAWTGRPGRPGGPGAAGVGACRYPAQRASAATDHASLCGDRARSHGGAGVRGRGTLTRARDGARATPAASTFALRGGEPLPTAARADGRRPRRRRPADRPPGQRGTRLEARAQSSRGSLGGPVHAA